MEEWGTTDGDQGDSGSKSVGYRRGGVEWSGKGWEGVEWSGKGWATGGE